jgi:hypothetical protein
MIKTIGFFGDSFCSEKANHHSLFYGYKTYINLLAKYYNAKIVNLGHGGTGVWDTLLIQLNPLIDKNQVPDICVFVWTLPGRLFNRTVRRLNHSDTLHPKLHTYNPFKYRIWNAAKEFYNHLYDHEKEDIEYKAALRYIDQMVLSRLPITTKIVHLWSCGSTVHWSNDAVKTAIYPYTWIHGSEIRPSLLSLSLQDADISILQTDHRCNHLDGDFKNNIVFENIKTAIDHPNKLYDKCWAMDHQAI